MEETNTETQTEKDDAVANKSQHQTQSILVDSQKQDLAVSVQKKKEKPTGKRSLLVSACCCVCCGKKVQNKEEEEDDKMSLTSQEINDFIEDEIRKMSEETITLEG